MIYLIVGIIIFSIPVIIYFSPKNQEKLKRGALKNQQCAACANRVVVAGINDLATTHIELAKEWHPTKNGN